MGLLNDALKYWELGWSIIPLGRDKRPLIAEWSPYQKRRATKDEIEQWWSKWPEANIGLVTGSISGVVVLDADSAEANDYIQKWTFPK
jgi:putative DNA primase/helicase